MARRSQLFTMMPWSGGLNDSADPGAIPPNDLVLADNIIYTTSGARIKRPGFNYIDSFSLPEIASISLTSNVVTIVFQSNISDSGNQLLVSGESINISYTGHGEFDATDVNITVVGLDTITYPLTHTNVSAITNPTGITITRSASIVGTHDFWYYDNTTNTKSQLILALTSQGKLFKYIGTDDAGRLEITKTTANVTATGASPAVFTLSAHGLQTGTAISFSAKTGGTGLSLDTVYYAEKIDANTFYLSNTLGGSRINLASSLSASTMSVPFALTLPVTSCDFLSINEKCLITCDGIKNFPIIFDPVSAPSSYTYISGAAPNASIMRLHEGRVVLNDKINRDRLHYSSPGNHLEYQGYGDSGVVDIGLGDGDPDGIVSILPSFKGALFISKTRTLYRMPDPGISTSRIELVSSGIGAVAHKAASPVDMDDVFFISDRGFHSLATTNNYGDFSGAFLSDKIQTSFSKFTQSRKGLTWGQYFPKYNSVFWSVAQDSASSQDHIYAYNIKFKEWYKWPNVKASCISQYKAGDTDRLMIATSNCRLAYLTKDSYSDYETQGISYTIRSGKIYVDSNPNSVKSFKRIGFIFPPKGNFTFTAEIKVDNQPLSPTNSISFSKTASGDLLGSTFILGQSNLSYTATMDPFMKPIDGVGRGLQVTIKNTGLGEQVEIYGIVVEYVPAGLSQETSVNNVTTE